MRIRVPTLPRRTWIILAGMFMLPSQAQSDWGSETWGELVWSEAIFPVVPGLGLLGMSILAAGLIAPAAWSLRKRRPGLGLTLMLVLLAIPLVVAAGSLTIPNTFVNGTVADANSVNANFDAVVTESNDQDIRIDILESAPTAHTHPGSDITSNVAEADTVGGFTGVELEETDEIEQSISTHNFLAGSHTGLQRRVGGVCSPGSSIRAISSTGSVTCELDSNSGGDIIGVTAGTGLNGGGTAGTVTLNLDVPIDMSGTSSYVIQGDNVGTGAGIIGSAVDGTGIVGSASSGVGGQFSSTTGYGLIVDSGNAGFGTTSPQAQLHVNSSLTIPPMRVQWNGSTKLYVATNGRVAIGVYDTAPDTPLRVDGGLDLDLTGGGDLMIGSKLGENVVIDGDEIQARNNGAASPIYINYEGGDVILGGETHVQVLHVTGGADLAERFALSSGAEAEPGTVVCIDPMRPGRLRICDQERDPTVAGVVSGAGGVSPGMLLGQAGTLADGNILVALTGRVYVRAETSGGPIRPGDLLTTAATAGTARRLTDRERAIGVVLGKAMTSLDSGEGLVLTLVSLQ